MPRTPNLPGVAEQRTATRTALMEGPRPNRRYVDIIEGGGHPEYLLKPAAYKLIKRMAAGGRDLNSIAAELGMNPITFRALRRRDPQAEAAVEVGRGALGDELMDVLLQHAREGVTVAAIFLAKARCGWREGEPMPGTLNQTNNTQINIQIPERMTDEEFQAVIDGTLKHQETEQ